VRNVLTLVLTLVCVCVVCSAVLALVNQLTAGEIREQEARKEAQLRAEVLAGAGNEVRFDEPVTIRDRDYFVGRGPDGDLAGTVFMVETDQGYGGIIRLIVGVKPDGNTLAGVRVLQHGETPGLGARIVEVNPGDEEPWFLAQFKGLASGSVYVKQDDPAGSIDAITAATISSRAVTNAVRDALDEFTQYVAARLDGGAGIDGEQQAEKEARLRSEVLGGPDTTIEFDEPVTVDGTEYRVGRNSGGEVVGTVFTVETEKGYGGPIRLVVGMAPDGVSVAGVRVLAHSETPGLGARIEEIAEGDRQPWFLDQFTGLTADQIRLKQDGSAEGVDAVTAATVSSNAVIEAVHGAVERFTESGVSELVAGKRDSGA